MPRFPASRVLPRLPDAPKIGRGADVHVGRQPIYDRDRNLVAYELLFRRGDVATADVVDGDQATFTVMLNALLEIGLERLVGDKKAFINLTRNSVLCEYVQFFDRNKVVMEVLEDVAVDDELLAVVRRCADLGYEIALDDFVYRDELAPLLDVAGMVKIDVQLLGWSSLRRHVEQFGNLKLLAEKVETEDEFDRCRDLGFDYFQGWFLGKPKVITVKHVPTSQAATLRLLTELHQAEADLDRICGIIRQDISLSYRILRTVGPMTSVEAAVKFLGLDQLRSWITLLSMSGQDDSDPTLVRRSMIRSRFCELVGERVAPEDADKFFVAGQLSSIDEVVGAPMSELLEGITLAPGIKAALLWETGPLSDALEACRSLESGRMPCHPSLEGEVLSLLMDQARHWADDQPGPLGH